MKISPSRRLTIALPVVLAATLGLAGCAAEQPSSPDGPETEAAPVGVCDAQDGDIASSVTVSGDFGSEPTVDFTAGLEVDQTERTVLVEGESAEPGQLVSAAYALYNATTGDLLESYGWADAEAPTLFRADPALIAEGFAKTLGCLGVGSRAVGVIPAVEGFGAAGTELGIGADDVLIFVVDIVGDNIWRTDLPEVAGTADAPTVNLPTAAPKTDLEIAVLEAGDGDVVEAADTVTVHYLGTAWETGEIFDQSYSRGEPATFAVSGVVQGFGQALIGQTVGSRVLVTMPPELGYGGQQGHPLQPYTLVFLIDVVAIAG